MLAHQKVSAAGASADPAKIGGNDWNADHVVDGDGLLIVADATTPAAPTAGFLNLHARNLAGGSLPAFIGPSGLAAALQPFLGRSKVAYWSPAGGSAVLTGTFFGMLSPNALGTATARTVLSTNLFTSMQRIGYVTSGTVNSRAIAYGTNAYLRGNAPLMGGFRSVFRFGPSDPAVVTNANSFYGMCSASSVGTGGTQPSASVNMIGVGADSGESDLSIMHNDGSGTATKIPLGANFPANTLSVDVYELILFCPPNASQIGWQFTRTNTGDSASGTITADLPAATQTLLPVFMRGNNSTALAVAVDVMGLYMETDN